MSHSNGLFLPIQKDQKNDDKKMMQSLSTKGYISNQELQRRQVKPVIQRFKNNVCKDGTDPFGGMKDFILKDRIKNIDLQRDFDQDPNNEYNIYYKQLMSNHKDDWTLGASKNARSKSAAEQIPQEKKEAQGFTRLTSDKFSYLPPNHPHEIKEQRKNIYNGNNPSQGWECNPNRFDRVQNSQGGFQKVKENKDLFSNPIIDGQKRVNVQDRQNQISNKVQERGQNKLKGVTNFSELIHPFGENRNRAYHDAYATDTNVFKMGKGIFGEQIKNLHLSGTSAFR